MEVNIFKWLFTESVDFYRLLQEQSELTLKGVTALERYMFTGKEEDGKEVTRLEKLADRKREELIKELDRTFITPFDREDIFNLSKAIDDILDYSDSTVEEMEIYELGPTPELREIVEVIRISTELIHESVCNLNKDRKEGMRQALQAKKYENRVENLYRKNLVKLFEGDDIKYILKMREIFRHLSNCADRIDLAGDILGHIYVKMI
jgi:predicted phosphate transport protein (TIGR00153 family)